jgi:hypothetical protein
MTFPRGGKFQEASYSFRKRQPLWDRYEALAWTKGVRHCIKMRYERHGIRFKHTLKRLFSLYFALRFYQFLMEYLYAICPILLDAYGACEYVMIGRAGAWGFPARPWNAE